MASASASASASRRLLVLAALLGGWRVEAQGRYSHPLHTFDGVVPSKTTSTGAFVSHQLEHHHAPAAPDTAAPDTSAPDTAAPDTAAPDTAAPDTAAPDTAAPDTAAPVVHYAVRVAGVLRLLDLWPNRRLLAPGARVERRRRGAEPTTTTPASPGCHFHGVVRGVVGSMVAVSACAGLTGLIRLPSGDFWVEPRREAPPSQTGHAHVVFRRSAVSVPPRRRRRRRKKQRRQQKNCGTREPPRVPDEREAAARSESRKSRKARCRRSVSRERHVEALVVADASMMAFHADGDVETYLLTIMNLVSALYREPSIGHPVNIAVVRVVLIDDELAERGLNVSVDAAATLDSFCRWQAALNAADDAHPDHHDVAVLVTRADICARAHAPCSTLGVAHVAGMCHPDKSCNVNEDNGITLAHTVAHELGHNFGMYHDTDKSGCSRRAGATLHVMTPSFEADTVDVGWSACSRRDITTFLDRGLGACLEDEPGAQDFHYPELPPGAMYDAERQCRMQFADQTATVCTPLEEICSRLWCQVNATCSTLLRPAAPGTHCGKHKWCSGQQCVEVGERPAAVPGGWGAWAGWSACSRPCDAGVATLERRCDNPAPAHGGRFCVGERLRHRVCNVHPCARAQPSFRAQQCAQKDNQTYLGNKYTWQAHFDAQEPCELYCADVTDSVLVPWGAAADGTPCRAGARDMCVGGACRQVGCDWLLDSDAVDDRCGVCRGDGSRCRTQRGVYARTHGTGYKEITVVPAGARNVLVEEIGNSRNFIGVGSAATGKFYLNGKRQISVAGEYEVGGATAQYERDRDNEKLRIAGPLKESILVYLIFRGRYRNFGVRFEFTELRAADAAQPRFAWVSSDWSACSVTCGGGEQRRRTACRELRGEGEGGGAAAHDDRCAGLAAPVPAARACNTHRCPARWWTGPWQHCAPAPAPDNINENAMTQRRRSVMCVASHEIAQPDAECADAEKPRETEPCAAEQWTVGRWGACAPSCGLGVRTRAVTCVHATCSLAEKPEETEVCRAHRHCRHEPPAR